MFKIEGMEELVEVFEVSENPVNEVIKTQEKKRTPRVFVKPLEMRNIAPPVQTEPKITGYCKVTTSDNKIMNVVFSLDYSLVEIGTDNVVKRFELNQSTDSRFKMYKLTSNGEKKTLKESPKFFSINSKLFREIDALVPRGSKAKELLDCLDRIQTEDGFLGFSKYTEPHLDTVITTYTYSTDSTYGNDNKED